MSVKPIPPGMHTIAPHLVVKDAAAALEFYQKAFGAKVEKVSQMPDGKVGHAKLQIGDSPFFLNDEFPSMNCLGPQGASTPVTLHLSVENVDEVFQRALNAGAKATMPLADQFWGDRYGKLVDPFGHHWSLSTHVEDVSPEEIEKRSQAACAGKP